jgi:hypothetical protein
VQVSIATVDEFFERVRPAHLALLDGPPHEPAVLEVLLAPGDYRSASFTVGDPLEQRRVDVVVRGADPDRPPLLTDLSLSLTGDQVRLENLIVSRRIDHLPIVCVTAGRSLTIDRCAFIGNQVRMPPEGRLVELVAANPRGATTATIRQSWFIRNWAMESQALLGCETAPPYHFDQVVFDRVAFLDNQAAVGIVPHATAAVQFAQCVVVQADADADTPPGVLAAVTSPGTRLTIDHSLLVADDLEHVVTRWSARHPSASAYQPVSINNSVVALRHEPWACGLPEGISLDRTQVGSAAPIDARADALVALIDRCVADAERGAAPDMPALRAAILP